MIKNFIIGLLLALSINNSIKSNNECDSGNISFVAGTLSGGCSFLLQNILYGQKYDNLTDYSRNQNLIAASSLMIAFLVGTLTRKYLETKSSKYKLESLKTKVDSHKRWIAYQLLLDTKIEDKDFLQKVRKRYAFENNPQNVFFSDLKWLREDIVNYCESLRDILKSDDAQEEIKAEAKELLSELQHLYPKIMDVMFFLKQNNKSNKRFLY